MIAVELGWEELQMSGVKEAAIQLIQSLPDDCTNEDILRHLYFREMFEKSSRDIEEGRICSQEEVDERMEQWLVSFGPTPPVYE